MEKFYLEKPTIKRKKEAEDYVKEFVRYGFNFSGVGKLKEILDKISYEEYLEYLENVSNDKSFMKYENVPQTTYFLIRKKDNKIVGITNLRHYLDDDLLKCGGHIGYGIRPKERNKGYGKIALYLTLKEAKKMGITSVRVDCSNSNTKSISIIKANDGKDYKSIIRNNEIINQYIIDLNGLKL